MNHQPPDAPDHGHCLRCKRFVIEDEQKSGICIDCQDGGQAFPSAGSEHGYPVGGMSLRDYFAAKAMQGQMQREKDFGKTVREQGFDKFAAHIAQTSYQLADAMLAERAK